MHEKIILYKKILIYAGENFSPQKDLIFKLNGYSEEEISYGIKKLDEIGLVIALDLSDTCGIEFRINDITSNGWEVINKLKNISDTDLINNYDDLLDVLYSKRINTDKDFNLSQSFTPVQPDRTNTIISKIKNHRILSIIIVFGIIIIGLGQVTDSFTKIENFLFPKSSLIKQDDEFLSVLIKVKNGFNRTFELNPLCEYEIMESEMNMINILSKGRFHLRANNDSSINEFIIKPNETKDYIVSFPNPKLYSLLLDRGSANIHFILRSNDLKDFFICSAPFDRISLKKYFVECRLDSIKANN